MLIHYLAGESDAELRPTNSTEKQEPYGSAGNALKLVSGTRRQSNDMLPGLRTLAWNVSCKLPNSAGSIGNTKTAAARIAKLKQTFLEYWESEFNGRAGKRRGGIE